ncbi:MAG: hypothetical protein ACK5WF_06025, partial [Cyclobacteriaceae bacterium]
MGFGLHLSNSTGATVFVEKMLEQTTGLEPLTVISRPVLDSIVKLKKIPQTSKEEFIQLNLA